MVKFQFNLERGNELLRDPQFGEKMHQLMTDLNVEAGYFTAVNGRRGGYFILSMNDASQIPAIAEPLFYWLHADVEFIPLMKAEDLQRAAPAIEAAIRKWDNAPVLQHH
ncbi:MAG TPA: hypothetical protein VNW99_09930 [Cytophagaceae bacterium]|nr:hypothetical protein [Cytophagaceae bacterium]